MAANNTKTVPEHVELNVEHYHQRYNWDCGVSCVLMVLPKQQREEFLENFTEVCQKEGFGMSTWTIDLCYLLKRFGVQHCMYTTVLGVNEDLRRHKYYEKVIDLDRERVQRRFGLAAGAGVRVVRRALGLPELVRHVGARGPAIALVDARRLPCARCRPHRALAAAIRQCWGGEGGGYVGHYVVVVGSAGGRVLYRDPGARARLCAAPLAGFAHAAAASGTDHDIILIYNNFR